MNKWSRGVVLYYTDVQHVHRQNNVLVVCSWFEAPIEALIPIVGPGMTLDVCSCLFVIDETPIITHKNIL
jgi:hypothetical protein